MKKLFNLDSIITVGSLIVCAIGVSYALGTKKKLNDVYKKIDAKIDTISDSIDVDIEKSIIDKAVDNAVKETVEKHVNKAISNVENDIHSEIRTAVRAIYPDIREACSEKVTDEVSKININDLKDTIREDATKKVSRKFDGQLDDILEKFNHDLDNISKIYSSISKRLGGTGSNSFNITI